MTDDDYTPIGCDQHSILELLAMRRRSVVARVRAADEADGQVRLAGRVIDILTHNGAEFLVLEQAGERLQLRLDRLLEVADETGALYWRQ